MVHNNGKEFEVADILHMRLIEGKKYFLIHWKEYPRDAATWEAEEDLLCEDLKKKFLKSFRQGPEYYKVRRILGHKLENYVNHYLVQWKNYPGEDQWIPRHQLEKCEALICQYHNSRKSMS